MSKVAQIHGELEVWLDVQDMTRMLDYTPDELAEAIHKHIRYLNELMIAARVEEKKKPSE